uniref:Candidate secreted effector n=1 Tax=Meloidogyne incognita TaxID=6306 RepID=A0A914N2P3_MELIC
MSRASMPNAAMHFDCPIFHFYISVNLISSSYSVLTTFRVRYDSNENASYKLKLLSLHLEVYQCHKIGCHSFVYLFLEIYF